ncbi:MAG TPA: serine/threonine-protein kinase [Gemmataceae bacterium]|nr:serine/threonine-protein kinase [Gemmataceae bacterium]
MSVPLDFLSAVGTSALPILTGTALAGVEVGSSILGKVWEWWGQKAREAERRKELEALAGMTSQQVKEAVKEVAGRLAPEEPPAVRSRLEGYLTAVPAQIRRTLRRPSDAAGLTVPPDLHLSRIEDLAPLLPPRPPRFAPGEKVPGTDFELVELLGIGGFGEVWKARNTFMSGAAPVALKFCLDPDAAASLRRETTLLDRIQREGKHPGIVELRNTFLSADPPFLEYELVEGGDLGGLILDWHRQKGGPTPLAAARVIRRLADVVAFAHAKGIVHRDLKPANILLQGARGEGQGVSQSGSSLTPHPSPLTPLQLKVADFGIGGIAAEAAARQARLTLATGTLSAAAAHGSYSLYYASPEQMRGAAPDPRDDVHALGVVWYQMLVGDLTAEAPRGAGWKKRLAAKGMSVPLVEMLEACVASDREDRPADAREIAERLGFILAEPAPGIELDLSADPHPSFQTTPALRPDPPPVMSPRPTESAPAPRPLSSLGRVAAEAQEQARWESLLSGLREIRSAQDRTKWSADWWVRALPRVLALVVALAAGLAAGAIARIEINDENRTTARAIAQENSTKQFRVKTESAYTNAVRFDLAEPTSSLSRSETSPEFHGQSYYYPYRPSTYTTTGEPTKEQKLAEQVNAALERCATEYDRRAQPEGLASAAGFATGGVLAVVLLPLVGWLRRRKLRDLSREVTATAERLQANFPREVADLAEHADLRNPFVVRHLIRAVEEERKLPPEVSPLGHVFHRAFAPF